MTTRGQDNIAWIERNLFVPEGAHVGRAVKLRPWQRRIIRGIYDTPTRRAIVSVGRKNGKTSLAAFLLLLHLAGPEAKGNAQLHSAAQSVEQAGVLFRLAAKIVRQSPALSQYVVIRDATKQLHCPELGTLYRALSAEVATAFGLSPVFAVHDEAGQIRGPRSPLYEAIESAMGSHDQPLSIVISTQAPNDTDLLSMLIDDASTGRDPQTKLFMWSAPVDADPFSVAAIKAANPAYGDFLSATEAKAQAADARRMPSRESSYRNLVLNQRVEGRAPFVAPSVWAANGAPPDPNLAGREVYAGLDLSVLQDLTALVCVAPNATEDKVWDVVPALWLPAVGLGKKSYDADSPFDLWHRQGYLLTTPGPTVEYEHIALHLRRLFDTANVRKVAFDTYGMPHLVPWLAKAGFSTEEMERFVPFRQGWISMSPAIRVLESLLLNKQLRHGDHPVLKMCIQNVRVKSDASENRRFEKDRQTGRIDGAVALAMAVSVALSEVPVQGERSVYETRGITFIDVRREL